MKHIIIVGQWDGDYDDSFLNVEHCYLINKKLTEEEFNSEFQEYLFELYKEHKLDVSWHYSEYGHERSILFSIKSQKQYRKAVKNTEFFKDKIAIEYFIKNILKGEEISSTLFLK